MKQLPHIKSLMFDSARYRVGDGHGGEVVLQVNYQENTYTLVTSGALQNPAFRQELAELATDLLSRKHGKNFAAPTRPVSKP